MSDSGNSPEVTPSTPFEEMLAEQMRTMRASANAFEESKLRISSGDRSISAIDRYGRNARAIGEGTSDAGWINACAEMGLDPGLILKLRRIRDEKMREFKDADKNQH